MKTRRFAAAAARSVPSATPLSPIRWASVRLSPKFSTASEARIRAGTRILPSPSSITSPVSLTAQIETAPARKITTGTAPLNPDPTQAWIRGPARIASVRANGAATASRIRVPVSRLRRRPAVSRCAESSEECGKKTVETGVRSCPIARVNFWPTAYTPAAATPSTIPTTIVSMRFRTSVATFWTAYQTERPVNGRTSLRSTDRGEMLSPGTRRRAMR